jgi:peptide deformylase
MEEKKLKIYKYGEDVLKLKAKDITNIDGKLVELIKHMSHTMHNTYSAIGLAAPQIGESIKLSVIDLSMGENEDNQILLINPEILEFEGKEAGDEGCLSFPGITVSVNRSTRILLKTLDINGNEIRKELDGFIARVIQHEIDHLDGTLIIDRISSLKKQFVKKEVRRLQKIDEW